MAYSCGASCIKYLLFFFNAVVFIAGAIITGFGIYLIVEIKKSFGGDSLGLPATILTLGLVLFIVGFFGCCGACKESICLLKSFAIIIGILLVVEIVLGIIVFVYREKFVDFAGEAMRDEIMKLSSKSWTAQEEFRKAMDALQSEMQCCGGMGPSDWGSVQPISCCMVMHNDGRTCKRVHATGCARQMYLNMESKAMAFGIVIIVLAILQLGAMIASCCLASHLSSYNSASVR